MHEFKPGISRDAITQLSKLRNEPSWLLDFRLNAFEHWKTMSEPHWSTTTYDPIDYQSITYHSKPTINDEIDADTKSVYDKLGIPEHEQRALMGMAVDAILDSSSIHTSYQSDLEKLGIIFMPMSDAIKKHPELVRKYLGTVVPHTDNFFACLNSAVFSDGTFVYIPSGVKCPIDLASYFRINTATIGQFERTLIIAESGSELSYLEGCSAPRRPNHQLHSGIVEIIAHDNSIVKYATVQNWYAGNSDGVGGIYNFVTKRGIVHKNAKLLWTQLEVGSAKTWKYPSSILMGDNSHSDFYSLSITRHHQMADTGTKMIHIGNNSTSNILSQGVAMEQSNQTFRSLITFGKNTTGAKSASNCDSKIIGNMASVNTLPTVRHMNSNNTSGHEAKTSAISESQLFFLNASGIGSDLATGLIIGGLAAPILSRLPMEFLIESKQLIQIAVSNGDKNATN